MKKVLLGGVALITLGFVGSAVAADMPVVAPVVVSTRGQAPMWVSMLAACAA
jgi:hypothetical protein